MNPAIVIPPPNDVRWGITAEAYAIAYACRVWSEALSMHDYCDRSKAGERAYCDYYREWEVTHGIHQSISAFCKAKEFVRAVHASAYPVPLPDGHEAWMEKWPRDTDNGCQWKRRQILEHWQHWFEAVIARALTDACCGRRSDANGIVAQGKALVQGESKERIAQRRIGARLAELTQPGKVTPPTKPLRKSQLAPNGTADDSPSMGGVQR